MNTVEERVYEPMAIYSPKGAIGSMDTLSRSMEGVQIPHKRTRRRNIIGYTDILKVKLHPRIW